MRENPDGPDEEEVLRALEADGGASGIVGIVTDPASERDRGLHSVLIKMEEKGRVERCRVADHRVDFFWWQRKIE